MNAFHNSPTLPSTVNEAVAIALSGSLTMDEASDFMSDWFAGHRNGVTFWLDTVAFRNGLPVRWAVPPAAA